MVSKFQLATAVLAIVAMLYLNVAALTSDTSVGVKVIAVIGGGLTLFVAAIICVGYWRARRT